MSIRSSVCDYRLLNIVFTILSCSSLRAAPLNVPPDTTISGTATFDSVSVTGTGVLTVLGGSSLTSLGNISLATGGRLDITNSALTAGGRIQLFPTGSTVNASGSTIAASEVDVDLTGSTFTMNGGTLATSGAIFVDGAIFENNAVGGIPGPQPFPVLSLTGVIASAGATVLAQSSTINITDTHLATPELDAFILGQININGDGTIITAQDAVFAGAGSTINIAGGLVQTPQLIVSGFNDGDVQGAPSTPEVEAWFREPIKE